MFVFLVPFLTSCSYCASILFQLLYTYSDIVWSRTRFQIAFLGRYLMLALLKGKAVKHIMESNTNSISHGFDSVGYALSWSAQPCGTIYKQRKQITTAKTTRRLPNKRLNELNSSCARELEITFALVLADRWKTTWLSSGFLGERERLRLIFRIFIWNWMLALHI